MKLSRFIPVVLFFVAVSTAFGQDAVPGEILGRTHMIKVGDEAGTAFNVDYNGKLYLVTARHVVGTLQTHDAKIQIMQSGEWKDYHIARVLFPESDEVDIAVLETDEKVKTPYGVSIMSGPEGPTFGQQVWFIGYPWGLHSHLSNGEIPFIKRGTMSAIDGTNPKAMVLYIDGFNNPGFSGGPILYFDFKSHAYRLAGVVKGYREDNANVLVNGKLVPTPILVNSGILIGYSAEHIIETIKAAESK
ncbi:MAG TPA: serine protease [Terriglobales bacterium]|nr:serine protease [Terriglobales bacterium]